MAKLVRTFLKGRMNKDLDERLVPEGEYIDAQNVRIDSSEGSQVGAVENSKGNKKLTLLAYNSGSTLYPLSSSARCIGSIEDEETETVYWFVHDPSFPVGATGKIDMVVSYEVPTGSLTYHVVSIDDGDGTDTTLNFDFDHLITGVTLVDDFLFWTDNKSGPRKINITRNYGAPVSDIDRVTREELLVIKKPPIYAPSVELVSVGDEDYIEEKFICFAYRYRYEDGEYSATSPFTLPAFEPKAFDFSTDSFLNEGMVNRYNSAIITFNTGGSLVKGIDLLFKEADSNVIKVITKINKADVGYGNNQERTFTFSGSKVYTILPGPEILRLYDNVPLLAKAQTVMGNRLMYGNYIEGYDLVDSNDNPVKLNYFVDLVEEEVGTVVLDSSESQSTYTLDGSVAVDDSVFGFELDGRPLDIGDTLSITFTFAHSKFSNGGGGSSVQTTPPTTVTFSFTMPRKYTSVYDLVYSQEFTEAFGVDSGYVRNYFPVPTSCEGTTFTDRFNCAIPATLSGYAKTASYITSTKTNISADLLSTAGTFVSFRLLAMEFDNGSNTFFEYYKITSATATYTQSESYLSLHSDRNYEVGIVYMDSYARATTALVSNNNSLYVPCGNAGLKNSIKVTIPVSQRPPKWATHYKFVVKADKEKYETIYSYLFFKDPQDTLHGYFLLDGENSAKVEKGDELIVKADTGGIKLSCTSITVLEKDTQVEGFLDGFDTDILVPAGVYMKVKLTNIDIESTIVTDFGDKHASTANGGSYISQGSGSSRFPWLVYPLFRKAAADDISIQQGSKVKFNIKFERKGQGEGNGSCGRVIYDFVKTFTASADYGNFKDWFEGDNIDSLINSGTWSLGLNETEPGNSYSPTELTSISPPDTLYVITGGGNKWRFARTSNGLFLTLATSTSDCGVSASGNSTIYCNVQIFEGSEIIFETKPLDAIEDLFYESAKVYDITNNNHMGDGGSDQDQNRSTGTPAVIYTDFANCFSFGNGAESYKIKDSAKGKSFGLGNRVTAVSAQDYKRAYRKSDITYSGVYNDESNVNKLNEFNLGLVNYKHLEDSFGPIQLMDARMTDILVLQSDKISYVLAGKNLLSDSVGGGTVASVPEVLGTQIARVEQYGISLNPESYVHHGNERYFTDSKRGAVLMLVGNSAGSDQLNVISDNGMKSWFRDLFINSENTQKIGAYDPYMEEYVLSSNDIDLPQDGIVIPCGTTRSFVVPANSQITYTVQFSDSVGTSTVAYFPSTGSITFSVSADYNSVSSGSGATTTGGTFSIAKDKVNVTTAAITIDNDSLTAPLEITVAVGCVAPVELTIIEVVLTTDGNAGELTHVEFGYTDGAYESPTDSVQVVFGEGPAPVISQYRVLEINQGSGPAPTNGSTVTMVSDKQGVDDFDFDPSANSFMYLRTNTLYGNNRTDMNTLLGAATAATPITTVTADKTYSAEFTMPSTGAYLYLVYDLRTITEIDLTYDATTVSTACCS